MTRTPPRPIRVELHLDAGRLRLVAQALVRLGDDFATVGEDILPVLDAAPASRLERRDAAIVELRETRFAEESVNRASEKIAADLRRFESSPRWTLAGADQNRPPPFKEGAEDELLCRIMRAGGTIRARRIRDILRSAHRQSGALDIAETSLAQSEDEPHDKI